MIDFVKLKELQAELDQRVREEFIENLDEEIIQFVVSKFFKNHFTEKKSRKETEQSARVLNNWEKEDIIAPIDATEGKHRKFNKVEAVWLDIVTTLRAFGLPIEAIKKVRKALFTSAQKKFSLLEYSLMHSIIQEAMVLMVFEEGEINLLPESLYAEYASKIDLPPHIHLNLLFLAQNEFPNNNFTTIKKSPKSPHLSESEMRLLYFIRTGDYESIRIRLKEGDIYLLEGTKRISSKSKITDILNKNAFQDIEVKTQSGEIVHISVTEKIKIK